MLLFFLFFGVNLGIFYVCDDGVDENNECSQENPCRTIQYICNFNITKFSVVILKSEHHEQYVEFQNKFVDLSGEDRDLSFLMSQGGIENFSLLNLECSSLSIINITLVHNMENVQPFIIIDDYSDLNFDDVIVQSYSDFIESSLTTASFVNILGGVVVVFNTTFRRLFFENSSVFDIAEEGGVVNMNECIFTDMNCSYYKSLIINTYNDKAKEFKCNITNIIVNTINISSTENSSIHGGLFSIYATKSYLQVESSSFSTINGNEFVCGGIISGDGSFFITECIFRNIFNSSLGSCCYFKSSSCMCMSYTNFTSCCSLKNGGVMHIKDSMVIDFAFCIFSFCNVSLEESDKEDNENYNGGAIYITVPKEYEIFKFNNLVFNLCSARIGTSIYLEGYDFDDLLTMSHFESMVVDITDLNSFNGKDLTRPGNYHTSLVPYVWCENSYHESTKCPSQCTFKQQNDNKKKEEEEEEERKEKERRRKIERRDLHVSDFLNEKTVDKSEKEHKNQSYELDYYKKVKKKNKNKKEYIKVGNESVVEGKCSGSFCFIYTSNDSCPEGCTRENNKCVIKCSSGYIHDEDSERCVKSEFYTDPLFWVIIAAVLVVFVVVCQCICLQRRKKTKSKTLMSEYAKTESKAQQALKKHADDMLKSESCGQLSAYDIGVAGNDFSLGEMGNENFEKDFDNDNEAPSNESKIKKEKTTVETPSGMISPFVSPKASPNSPYLILVKNPSTLRHGGSVSPYLSPRHSQSLYTPLIVGSSSVAVVSHTNNDNNDHGNIPTSNFSSTPILQPKK